MDSTNKSDVDSTNKGRGWRRWGTKAALAFGGLLVGGVLAGTLTASAADTTTSTANQNGTSASRTGANIDEFRSRSSNEKPLTGETASKVRAAALAKHPGATVLRVQTDSDGVYEAHLETTDGKRVIVKVNKAFKVTGEETC
jgi:hypothetical protein